MSLVRCGHNLHSFLRMDKAKLTKAGAMLIVAVVPLAIFGAWWGPKGGPGDLMYGVAVLAGIVGLVLMVLGWAMKPTD